MCFCCSVPAILSADGVAVFRVLEESHIHSDQRCAIHCHHLSPNHSHLTGGGEERRGEERRGHRGRQCRFVRCRIQGVYTPKHMTTK